MISVLESLLERVANFSFCSNECRRRHRRFARRTLVTIQELDNDLSGVSGPIWGMTTDISQGGLGFECKRALSTSVLRITINEDGVSYIGEVRHFKETEGSGWFYGIEFVNEELTHIRR